ncbi:MAG: hypothetical protein ACTSQO_10335 [Candidatus Helarchaeota archaeon]
MILRYPLLINNTPDMKITMVDYKVLYHCNGLNDISAIREKTGLSDLEILMIIRKFVKKGKIRIKYSLSPS